MLVKFALLYAFIQLDIVGLPQNSEHFVVDLPYSLIGVFDEFEYAHKHFTFVEDALKADSMEYEAVDAVQHLADELRVIFLAQKESEYGLEEF